MRKSVFSLSLLPLLIFSFALSVPAYAQDYSLTLLPTLGGKFNRASAINEHGQITGQSDEAMVATSGPFLWSRTDGIQDLGTLGGVLGSGNALNASAQVTGYSTICCEPIAIVWSAATGMEKIKASPEFGSAGNGINDNGDVVGVYNDQTESSHGFYWTQLGGLQDLASLGCVGCLPNAINNSGEVTGTIPQPDGSSHAFVWAPTSAVQDLGTLGGPNSAPHAINNAGQVVGVSDTAGGVQHAFSWSAASGMQDLGTLPGESYSGANAIDDAGRVVGSSWGSKTTKGHPFSWTQAGGMTQLGPLKPANISSADGVNSAGLIILSAYRSSGYSSYLMTPLMITTLTSSVNPSQAGESVTFTANVNSATQGPPPDGEIVTFTRAKQVIGTGTLLGGAATFTTSSLTGVSAMQAVYTGDSNYASSKSAPLKQVVVK